MLHAPGTVVALPGGRLTTRVSAWTAQAYRVLLTRLRRPPVELSWNDQSMLCIYLEEARAAIITLTGAGVLEVTE